MSGTGALGMSRRQMVASAMLVGASVRARTSFAALPSPKRTIIAEAPPISPAERLQRVARIQAAMRADRISVLLVEGGSTLDYLTGVQWGRSERLTGALIPADGEVTMITPFFEEPRVRERLAIPASVRVWQEDEKPASVIAGWMQDRRISAGTVAVEETVRFFIVDALRAAVPDATFRSGATLVNGVRMRKSPAELALMQRATDITIAAYRQVSAKVVPGMRDVDIAEDMKRTMVSLGGSTPWAGVQVGEGSAYPHGSTRKETVAAGVTILMDCGCAVGGYQSDVSRTFIYGEPSREQRKVWDQVHRGQEVAFEAARIGATCGSVDDAVRAYYEKEGYGPRYKLPGLSHRTGHGIGMDVHEPVNLVHGEETALAPGMCFSDEPGLYLPGKYGVRLEDCFYMTMSGPRFFSRPPPSIDDPFG